MTAMASAPRNLEFPEIVAAIESTQSTGLEIGRAVLARVGPASTKGRNDGSRPILQKISAELATLDFDYSPARLAKLRTQAQKWPDGYPSGMAARTCESAGDPARLELALSRLGNKPVLCETVREVLKAYDVEMRELAIARHEAAQGALDDAKRAKDEADRILQTVDTDEEGFERADALALEAAQALEAAHVAERIARTAVPRAPSTRRQPSFRAPELRKNIVALHNSLRSAAQLAPAEKSKIATRLRNLAAEISAVVDTLAGET